MLLPQDVENRRGPAGVRAIVEGQRDQPRAIAGPLHDIIGGQHIEAFIDDQIVGITDKAPVADLRPAGDRQDFTVPFHVDFADALHFAHVRDPTPAIGPLRGPVTRILRAKAPQRKAGHPLEIGGTHLVPGTGGVEHPDRMLDAIFLIGEAGIAAQPVELGGGAAVVRDPPRVFVRQRIPAAGGGPVIAVIADRDDRLRRGDRMERGIETLIEPQLAGDRPRLAVIGMFVIVHQDQPIGDPGESPQVP
jgi:hypothetical protein